MLDKIAFETSILGFLSHRPLSGYQLYKEIEEIMGRFSDKKNKIRISKSSVYNILNKMHEQKFIQFREKKDSRNTKEFFITAKGKKYLEKTIETRVTMPVFDPLEYICGFSSIIESDKRKKLLDKRISVYNDYLKILEYKKEKYKEIFTNDKYTKFIISRAEKIIKSDIKEIKKLQDD
ncbi:helix-turn-helix transcriptional regulator [Candidatus Woesearchaeota archaeon]|nr:helix-turn-helix transcriptional regulator [Candidatus Woesearchaeota archaeon]